MISRFDYAKKQRTSGPLIRVQKIDNDYMDILIELVIRLRKVYAAVFVSILFMFFLPESIVRGKISFKNYSPVIYKILAAIIDHSVARLPKTTDIRIQIISPTTVLSTSIFLAIVLALIICSPYIAMQFYEFVAPGLYPNERRLLKESFFILTSLFLLGASLGYFLIAPITLNVLTTVSQPLLEKGEAPLILFFSLERILSLVVWTVISTGFLYMLPGIIYFLVILDIVDAEYLVKNRKNVIFSILSFAAVLTPDPTMVSMLILSGPLIVIYEIIVQRGMSNKRSLKYTQYRWRMIN